ncbi:MAG TPA: hypothetical protein VEA40_04080 [Ramlibacter sp.]|nr:hypothetical protein [Ramlibacter sp.]
MRTRMLLLVLAIVLVAGFAAQNWAEITRSSLLNFGILQAEAPLGLILLTLLGLTALVALAGMASMRTRSLVETRQHVKELHAQRELADKAEASRFTELRTTLESHLRDSRQRETIANTEMEKSMAQHHRELRNQLEQMYHLLTNRLGELERRLDGRPAARAEHSGVGHSDTVVPGREYENPARAGEPVVADVRPHHRI